MDIKVFNLSALIWSKYGLPEIITKCGNLKFKAFQLLGTKEQRRLLGSRGRKTSNKIPGDSEKSGESNGVNGIVRFVADVPLNQYFRGNKLFQGKTS